MKLCYSPRCFALFLLCSYSCMVTFAQAFSSPSLALVSERRQKQQRRSFVVGASAKQEAVDQRTIQEEIESNIAVLTRAADTKQEDSDEVYEALVNLEQQMRTAAKLDDSLAVQMLEQLTGEWRLIFTTGTANTQKRRGGQRINYFPIKAVQSFDTTVTPNQIENGIYLGDFEALKFQGDMEFDLKKRRLNFDFNSIQLLNGLWKIPLKKGEAASLGAKSGLGSESNVANASKKEKSAFFNWISADQNIATARGGGGGLALWKRIK